MVEDSKPDLLAEDSMPMVEEALLTRWQEVRCTDFVLEPELRVELRAELWQQPPREHALAARGSGGGKVAAVFVAVLTAVIGDIDIT